MRLLSLHALALLCCGVAVAQDCINVALTAIPACAQNCILNGAPSIGCQGTDFSCQCAQSAALYAAVEGCVSSACPSASYQAVIDGSDEGMRPELYLPPRSPRVAICAPTALNRISTDRLTLLQFVDVLPQQEEHQRQQGRQVFLVLGAASRQQIQPLPPRHQHHQRPQAAAAAEDPARQEELEQEAAAAAPRSPATRASHPSQPPRSSALRRKQPRV